MSDLNALPPAGFWRRFATVMLDGLVFSPISIVGMIFFLGDPNSYIAFSITLYGLLCAYYIFMLACPWQATIGMRLMQVYGVDTHGNRLTKKHVLKWIVVSMLFFLVAMLPLYVIVPPGATLQEQIKAMNHPYYWYANGYMYAILIAWAFTIGLSKRKVGLHNRMVGVRFLKGRPE